MECIKCGGKSRVVNSRCSGGPSTNNYKIPSKFSSLPKPFVYRDHKCTECQHNFQSIELPAFGLLDKMEKMELNIKKMVKNRISELLDL